MFPSLNPCPVLCLVTYHSSEIFRTWICARPLQVSVFDNSCVRPSSSFSKMTSHPHRREPLPTGNPSPFSDFSLLYNQDVHKSFLLNHFLLSFLFLRNGLGCHLCMTLRKAFPPRLISLHTVSLLFSFLSSNYYGKDPCNFLQFLLFYHKL